MKIWQFIELPDYVTLLSGIAAVIAMFQAIEQHFALAALLMLASVICDYLDGKIARAVNRQNKQFGSVLDTVTDIVWA
jgi:phosphatidylserine synthase